MATVKDKATKLLENSEYLQGEFDVNVSDLHCI